MQTIRVGTSSSVTNSGNNKKNDVWERCNQIVWKQFYNYSKRQRYNSWKNRR